MISVETLLPDTIPKARLMYWMLTVKRIWSLNHFAFLGYGNTVPNCECLGDR